jgi:DNA (cytosine-5)-methyltransferase 3A
MADAQIFMIADINMNVVSLFNGMNTGRQALENVGIKVDNYYSSEIKPYAIELTQYHFPDTIQVGDVTKWREWDIDWQSIDLILSGSPCQDLSAAGKRAGINGSKSSLFFVFVEILEHIKSLNPKVLFLQENVGSASKLDVGIMSRALGVYPCRINSSLVTAQLRDRYYWSNIRTKETMFDIVTDIPQPKDLGIMFKDIITSGKVNRNKAGCLMEGTISKHKSKNPLSENHQIYLKSRGEKMSVISLIYEHKTKNCIMPEIVKVRKNNVDIIKLQKELSKRKISINEIAKKLNYNKTQVEHWFRTDKFFSIPNFEIWLKLKDLLEIKTDQFDEQIMEYIEKESNYDQSNRVYNLDFKSPCLTKTNHEIRIKENEIVRIVNQIEMERLQGFPDGYTSILSQSKAGSLLGDGWTLPIIEHIFKFIN